MIAPNAPDTTPDPMYELLAPRPGSAEGESAEQIGYQRARESWRIANAPPAARNGTFGGRALTVARVDVRSPQIFEAHPKISELAGEPAVPGETAFAHLPGRLLPSTWDGEPRYGAPTVGGQ